MTDALVIGSGPNGLAAAIRVAEAGRSVLVLEAAAHPGGAVRTEELTLPGFRHDTFSSVYPAGAASPVWRRMPLHEHGLAWIQPEAASAHVLPGGLAAVLYPDLARTAYSLDALHRGDGEAWARFARPFLHHFAAVRDTMLSGFPPLGGPLHLLARAGPLRLLDFARLLPGSATGLARRLFSDGGSRAWLYSAALHGDTPPGRAGSAIAAFYLNLLGHAVGWPSPRGGAQALTDALVSYLRSRGGEVRTGARVEAITSAGGRVTGVRVAGGEALTAPVVVATVMPQDLLRMTGDALSAWYRAGISRYRVGAATMKLDWALDGPIPWRNAQARTAGTVHVGGSEDEFLATVATSQTALPERPFLLLGQQTVADPTRAPEGKHTAWAYTHGPAAADWAPHAERMEAQVERYAPGFRDRILARHVMGPSDLQARDANLIDGDVGGGSYRLRQVIFRPVPALSPYKTPLDGLFLGGASTFPGGAVHGVPGDAAARAALRSSSSQGIVAR
ncbi:phytoene desaturase family protein [Candidatus Solirubrobacter pratensis]|uniref:phytoene desaturase family protein n=1 Tax=Candidatus Solirubrobacter pratensis TaxID=1298857 RepID=UPI000409901B|nr:NAD(P)/FAD-dependent oxidoreductase [Candidatus Solirubrobacter pratensis]